MAAKRRKLDRAALEAYAANAKEALAHSPPAADSPSVGRTRRRRLPSPQEQARREEWGKTWGAMVSRATAGLRKG